jgi:hypothetical protein
MGTNRIHFPGREFASLYHSDIPRHLRFYALQAVGVPALLCLPLFAFFGLLDDKRTTERVTTPSMEVEVDYSYRTRYSLPETVEVRIRNVTEQTLENVALHLDPHFFPQMRQLVITPAPEQAYSVSLGRLAPGEVKTVRAEYRNHLLGRSRATIWAQAPEEPKAAVIPLRFWIYP